MATFELRLPKLGESVTEGTLGKWLKKSGDKVEKYELLVEVQTDKVSTEIPSPVSGTLKEIKVQEGETVPNNSVIATLEVSESAAAEAVARDGHRDEEATPAGSQPAATAGAVAESAAPRAPAAARTLPSPAAAPSQPEAQRPTAAPQVEEESGPTRATPVVRRLAAEHGIDLAALQGSGLGGRVTRQDVEAAMASQRTGPPAPPTVVAPAATAASRRLRGGARRRGAHRAGDQERRRAVDRRHHARHPRRRGPGEGEEAHVRRLRRRDVHRQQHRSARHGGLEPHRATGSGRDRVVGEDRQAPRRARRRFHRDPADDEPGHRVRSPGHRRGDRGAVPAAHARLAAG